ncbi:MAG: UvrD-helicase domain-containing protein [Woeseiaceae bacterium]
MSNIEQLSGHTTVQASAGSGKTYLLISRVVRLLLTGTDAGNILAITFTKKAANEMQTRLLARLYELAVCDDKELEEVIRSLHLPVNENTLALSRQLYEKILHSESPVKTSTFHAFCQELLRRFPMEANISPGFDLLDKTSLFYEQAWQATMSSANSKPESELAKAIQFLFKEFGLFNSKQALTNFLEHRSDWWAYTTNENEPTQFAQDRLQQQLNIDPNINPIESLLDNKELMSQLNEFHVLLCKHSTATNLKYSDKIYIVIEPSHNISLRYQSFYYSFFTQTGTPIKRKESAAAEKKMGTEGQQRFLELNQIICNEITKANNLIDTIKTFETSSAWFTAGAKYLEHFQKIKKEQRLLDFTDLEWQTYLLLNESNNAQWVQYKLDQRIEHLLIDEFQDTNPTQWQLILPILKEMAASEEERERSVFIVGDAKQSIYRFRRAEPRLFLAAESWLKENLNATTQPLSYSWRSSPAIIDFINTIFTQDIYKALMPSFTEHATHKKELAGKVVILPLNRRESPAAVSKDENTPLKLRNPLDEPNIKFVNQHYFNEGLQIANKIQTLITDRTSVIKDGKEQAIGYDDIIILLRSRSHVSDYERAFRQEGIPYIGATKGTLLKSLEVADMLDLLHWLILPYDNLSLAGILRSPIFSVTNDDLIEISQISKGSWFERLKQYTKTNPKQVHISHALALLTRWQEASSKLPVHDLLDKIYSEANVLERYAAAFPKHLKQRVTANLTRFLELALEMDSGRYPSITRFSSWLNELQQVEKESPDEPISQTNEFSQRVQILTVHAAKGLEAPVVFLADCANSPLNKRAYTTLIDWPAENDRPDYFLLTAAKKNLDPYSESCIKQQEKLEQQENANLLYVAVTRAKQMLFISGSEPKTKDHGWYEKICTAYKYSTIENEESVNIENQGEFHQAKNDETTPDTPAPTTLDGKLLSPIKVNLRQLEISPSQQIDYSHTATKSNDENTLRGVVMHQMLNILSVSPSIQLKDFSSNDAIDIEQIELEAWWQRCQAVINTPALKQYFDSEKIEQFYNEVPIQFKENNEMVFGIIDRLILSGNKAIIIDYKTHPYINKDNIMDVANKYQEQMQLYKKGVELLWPKHQVESILLFTETAETISI